MSRSATVQAPLAVRAREQLTALLGPLVEAVRGRQWGRLWLSGVAAALVIGLALAFRTRPGHAFMFHYAITRPGDGIVTTLVKLPLSMFAPAALLPFWFAVFQVLVVYALAQTLIGAARTIAVAVSAHALSTFSAHLWVAVGRPLGVPHRYAHFGDAGPSVAVIALLAYLAVLYRVGWLALAILAYHVVEVAVFDGLSQREHVVGTLTGILAAVVTRWRRGRSPGTG